MGVLFDRGSVRGDDPPAMQFVVRPRAGIASRLERPSLRNVHHEDGADRFGAEFPVLADAPGRSFPNEDPDIVGKRIGSLATHHRSVSPVLSCRRQRDLPEHRDIR